MKGQKEGNVTGSFPLGNRMMNSFQSWPGSGPSARNKQLLVVYLCSCWVVTPTSGSSEWKCALLIGCCSDMDTSR